MQFYNKKITTGELAEENLFSNSLLTFKNPQMLTQHEKKAMISYYHHHNGNMETAFSILGHHECLRSNPHNPINPSNNRDNNSMITLITLITLGLSRSWMRRSETGFCRRWLRTPTPETPSSSSLGRSRERKYL